MSLALCGVHCLGTSTCLEGGVVLHSMVPGLVPVVGLSMVVVVALYGTRFGTGRRLIGGHCIGGDLTWVSVPWGTMPMDMPVALP